MLGIATSLMGPSIPWVKHNQWPIYKPNTHDQRQIIIIIIINVHFELSLIYHICVLLRNSCELVFYVLVKCT